MRFVLGSLLALAVMLPASAADRVYQAGKLVGATTDSRDKKGTTTTHAIFTVETDGLIYTVRGKKVGAKAKDYTKGMIVGDPVEASVEGNHLYLRTADGKQIKTDVLKRARADAAPVQ